MKRILTAAILASGFASSAHALDLPVVGALPVTNALPIVGNGQIPVLGGALPSLDALPVLGALPALGQGNSTGIVGLDPVLDLVSLGSGTVGQLVTPGLALVGTGTDLLESTLGVLPLPAVGALPLPSSGGLNVVDSLLPLP